MTIKEMHSWFDILQAEGMAIEFTAREKDHILNRAQIKYVNEVLQKKYLPSLKANEKAELVYSPTESVISGHDAIHPLLGIAILSASSGGTIYFDDINTEMDSRLVAIGAKPSGYSGSKFMMILGVADPSNQKALRYINGYDRYKNRRNSFRQPRDYDPIYQLEENHINIDPNTLTASGTKEFVIHCIREPQPMLFDVVESDRVNCELPEFTHDEIMAIALDDAGVATRDDALMKLNTANKDNLTESM